MRKNGFTLIELLAVIVILAIIALIATPIILGIIKEAREKSNERSVELYASAVRNGIAAYQLRTGNEVATGTYNETNKLPFEPDYEGKVECSTVDVYTDGKIYVADCTINGTAIDYTYGEKQEIIPTQVFKPQYYGCFSGNVNKTAVPETPSNVQPVGKKVYIGYDVADGKISTSYVCFVRNEIEYCLKGTTDGSATHINEDILKDAYADVVDTDICYFGTSYAYCTTNAPGGIGVSVFFDGYVTVNYDNTEYSAGESFYCQY